MAEAAAWRKRNFSGSSSALGSAVAARWQRWKCGFGGVNGGSGIGGGSGGSAASRAKAAREGMDDVLSLAYAL